MSLLGRIATHQQNGLEFCLAAEKRVEELTEPGDGEDGIVVGGGRQKIGEAVNDRKEKMEKKPNKGEREEGRRSDRKKKERKYEGERESLFNKLKEQIK
jgi:hypothetical protein